MRPRQNIIEMFSTFVQFTAEHFSGWATDARLRRSIQSCVNKTPQESSDNFWALYWYKVWQATATASVAKAHLVAYLQETCYWASQKTAAGFASTQYKLSDCFQIAIAQTDRILKGFNPDQGYILKNYASAIYASVIRETLRQKREVDICTDWGLLRKISQKRLLESLEAVGLPKETSDKYILAWNCWRTLYVPPATQTSRQLSAPDSQTWEAIAKLYNSQTKPEVTPQTLDKWLQSSAKAVRYYLYPQTTNVTPKSDGDESLNWLENIPANSEESLVDEIIALEEEKTKLSQLAQINEILKTSLKQLEPAAQDILQMYYAKGITQQQIAKELQIQQYTVSRRLTKARETLLRAIAKWSQQELHISVNSDILKSTSGVMEEWLQAYYSSSSNDTV